MQLQRLTTHYVLHEDRIRICGQTEQGDVVVLWLTQRLLNRLVPYLCEWLQAQSAAAVPQSLQPVQHSFAQQAAQTALQQSQQAPVQLPQESGSHVPAVLVHAVDIGKAQAQLTLAFKDGQGTVQAHLVFTEQALRQWLSIVQVHYIQAQWPQQGWPQWLQDAVTAAANTAGAAAHLH